MIEKKKLIIPLIAAIAIVLVVVVGITFAYFQTRSNNEASTDVKVSTRTTDAFDLDPGAKLTITADQYNLANGVGNRDGEATAKAMLKANDDTGEASETYNVYFTIPVNEFVHSADDGSADLVLQLFDPEGNEITDDVEGLDYVTFKNSSNEDVSGYDITEAKGTYTFVVNRTISIAATDTEKTKEEVWTVRLTLANLMANQNINLEKSLKGYLVLGKELSIASACTAEDKLSDCIESYLELYDENTASLYHHDGTHTAIVDEVETVMDAEDDSYRFFGASPKNYVCFGYDDNTKVYALNWCPNNNLYRIIGAFKNSSNQYEVKLIREKTYGEYAWSGSTGFNNNDWNVSTLNSEILNGSGSSSYLSSLGDYADLITIHEYINTYSANNGNAKEMYNDEINQTGVTTSSVKIGLMYVSDYMYAAPSNTWTNSCLKNNNWIHFGSEQWTNMKRNSDTSAYITTSGCIGNDGPYKTKQVRPVFYLNNTVKFLGGLGTKSNPIRIG